MKDEVNYHKDEYNEGTLMHSSSSYQQYSAALILVYRLASYIINHFELPSVRSIPMELSLHNNF